jgi:methionyl-tRNA synthetase
MKGKSILMSTGTDEHGLKVFEAAALAAVPPQRYCDEVSGKFKTLFDSAGVGYTDFIRTTEERHAAVVHEVWNRLDAGGYIYKGKCVGTLPLPTRQHL